MEVEDEAIRSLRIYSAWQESCFLYPCPQLHDHVNYDVFLGGGEVCSRKKSILDIFGAREFYFSTLGLKGGVEAVYFLISFHIESIPWIALWELITLRRICDIVCRKKQNRIGDLLKVGDLALPWAAAFFFKHERNQT